LRSARRLVPDPVEAQNLLQTALGRTYGRWDGIADKSLADACLRRVMINTRTEWWRARKLVEVPIEQLPDDRIDDTTEQHAGRALLLDVLKVLAPKQRSVVVLRHWEQMSTEETAAVLGMSTGTVKRTLHRALARLRQKLESREQAAQEPDRGERGWHRAAHGGRAVGGRTEPVPYGRRRPGRKRPWPGADDRRRSGTRARRAPDLPQRVTERRGYRRRRRTAAAGVGADGHRGHPGGHLPGSGA
jgi:RNA polymerase sigma-70 factor (sigma-E family)